MHFIKTIVSVFAVASFASAFAEEADAGLSRRALAEGAEEEYLVARDDLQLGGNGTCRGTRGGAKYCYKGSRACGPCSPTAATGQYCLCNA
ncbi:unnamed protein product [Clonostachys rosea]|uniref:Invertebrate defensins family profile domain-containing protein n=1 Tax=Bionectria ochroleuca TaxID=29856 RepID=A0ABY6U516_BIOOC|nr:unnamed protein product [Clonostachys rosea]